MALGSKKKLTVAAVAALGLLAVPGSAFAASAGVTTGGQLTITDPAAEANALQVFQNSGEAANTVRVRENNAATPLVAQPGCSVAPAPAVQELICVGVSSVNATLGNETDSLDASATPPGANNIRLIAGIPVAVNGQGGTDTITGSISADNALTGGPGADTINGMEGADTINGGDEADTLNGGADADTINGDNGADTLNGGTGNDILRGHNLGAVGDDNAADTINGDANDDQIFGQGGDDPIDGGTGNDTIDDGPGNDTGVNGGVGNDTFVTGTALQGSDTYNGGDGTDRVDYSARLSFGFPVAITASTDGTANDGAPGEADDVGTQIESFLTGGGADTIRFQSALTFPLGVVDTGDSTDLVSFEEAGAVNISLDGVANDTRIGNTVGPPSVPFADAGNVLNVENLVGSRGNDVLNGSDGNNVLKGLAGNDTVNGQGGSDTLQIGNDAANVIGQTGGDAAADGTDTYSGGSPSTFNPATGDNGDTLSYRTRPGGVVIDVNVANNDGGAGENDNVLGDIETIGGTGFSDIITLGANDNQVFPYDGTDQINTGDGDDLINDGFVANAAGSGRQPTDGDTGPDSFDGGPGTDTVTYASRTGAGQAQDLVISIDNQANDGADPDGDADADENDNVRDTIENVTTANGDDAVIGSNVANVITTGDGEDSVDGLGGDDTIATQGGADGADDNDLNTVANPDVVDDAVNGGDGNDTINTGDGNDTDVNGGVGNDTINTGADDDYAVDGGTGNDVINAGPGSDGRGPTVAGEPIRGGDGDDTINGGDGAFVNNVDGSDILRGDAGNDTIAGDNGGDDVDGGADDDILLANDQFLAGNGPASTGLNAGNNSDDSYSGGSGTDLVTYAGRNGSVALSLDTVANDGATVADNTEQDNINADGSVENVTGGNGDDTINGGPGANVINSGPGSDTIDVLNRDAGDTAIDSVTCGSGNDQVAADVAPIMDTTAADCETVTAGTTPPPNQGPPGPPGQDGATGQTGASGQNGQDGATGPAGQNGATGPAGAQGIPGTAAAKGDKGDTGSAGANGPAGPAGAAGPQGPAGAAGAAGARGPAGADGAKGSAGARGATGLTGRISSVRVVSSSSRSVSVIVKRGTKAIGGRKVVLKVGGKSYRGTTKTGGRVTIRVPRRGTVTISSIA